MIKYYDNMIYEDFFQLKSRQPQQSITPDKTGFFSVKQRCMRSLSFFAVKTWRSEV